MSHEEGDTCMSSEEEDTCMSNEEEEARDLLRPSGRESYPSPPKKKKNRQQKNHIHDPLHSHHVSDTILK